MKYVEVKVRLPAGIYRFFKDLCAFDAGPLIPEQMFQEEIKHLASNIADQLGSTDWLDKKSLLKKYGIRAMGI